MQNGDFYWVRANITPLSEEASHRLHVSAYSPHGKKWLMQRRCTGVSTPTKASLQPSPESQRVDLCRLKVVAYQDAVSIAVATSVASIATTAAMVVMGASDKPTLAVLGLTGVSAACPRT